MHTIYICKIIWSFYVIFVLFQLDRILIDVSFNCIWSCSSFSIHLEHKLSKEEVDNMSTKKWKYKWEVPVVGMSNCKWMGTEECFLKVSYRVAFLRITSDKDYLTIFYAEAFKIYILLQLWCGSNLERTTSKNSYSRPEYCLSFYSPLCISFLAKQREQKCILFKHQCKLWKARKLQFIIYIKKSWKREK